MRSSFCWKATYDGLFDERMKDYPGSEFKIETITLIEKPSYCKNCGKEVS